MKPISTQDGDKFTSGPVMSTRMMPPPHLQAPIIIVSQKILKLLPGNYFHKLKYLDVFAFYNLAGKGNSSQQAA